MKQRFRIRPLRRFALAIIISALSLAATQAALADIKEIEGMPLTMKVGDIDALVRSAPAGAGVERGKAQDGGALVTIAKGNDGRVLRFTLAGDLLILAIEHRAMPMPAYRKSVLDFIGQHGTPDYIYLPKVAGYPAGAQEACLSPGSKPGRAVVDTACLKRHLPKEPQAFASWVETYIVRTGRQPDLFWNCKTSAGDLEILAEKSEPPACFVKISAGNDCTGVDDRAACHQFVKFANFPPASGPPTVAHAKQQKKDAAIPVSPRAGKEQRDPKSVDDLVTEGKTALAQNKPDVALRKFRIAKMKAGGASPELQQLIAEAEKKTVSAGGVTEEDQRRKERIRAALRKATEAGALSNYDAQIGALSEVLEIDPDNIDALKSRQQAYENAGKPELALKDAEARVALDSTDPFAQRDVARLKKQLSASRTQNPPEATTQAADSKPAHVPGQQEASRPLEALEKPYDISGLPLKAGLPEIESFLQSRTGNELKRSESEGEVRLEGKTDGGSWSVAYDTNNSTLLRAEFASRKIPIEVKRKTYTAIMRKYGMPYYLKTEYGKLLAQRTNNSGSNASPRLQEDNEKMGQCYSTCCGGGEKVKACSPHPPVNACFNDCYYPKPPQDVEALLKWLFVDEPSMAQLKILYDGVMPTYWSCARSEAGDVLRSREQRGCYIRFDINTYKTDFKYSLQFENASAIERSKERISLIQKDKEKIERERASQARTDAYRGEKAAREARYASIDEMIAKRYPYIAPERLEFLREKWRSYEDFRLWMANELKLAYWQSVPEAERETKLLEALTTNGYRPGGPNYSDAHMRSAAQDYLGFEDLRRSFDTNNTRAMIDKATADPQFASIADEKARRKAALAELHKRHPEQMKFYLGELEKVRHCYNNGSIPAGKIGGVTTYKQAPGCRGYTTTRDVNAGMAKRPNWEP